MLKVLTNPWLIRVVGFLAVMVVVLLLGPLFAFGDWRPLESLSARWIFILLIVVAWLLRHVLRSQKANRAESRMVEDIVSAPAPDEPDATSEELKTLKARFEEALGVLKKARGGKGRLNLYDLPWYVIIGPPGSGKTTALANSGLRFPLRERFGPDAIRGVGGTRNCDWWFTDDAVLIDTAGRYTTQDSDAKADGAAWLGFLSLLKKYRKRRPINGIFVAISVSDLLTQSDAERRAHAVAIRDRIVELDRHLGVRFPVYVLFTKCDLVAGFAEYFEDLSRSEREQVWGFTFPWSDAADTNVVAGFDAEFELLVRRLNERLLARIGQEQDVTRRALIHAFPKQMAALKDSLRPFLTEIFEGSRYESSPMLRGAYFTSGTQEGTPIDRLMGTLARTFHIDQQALAPQHSTGRSFFLTDLLRRVVFAEANIAGTNRKVERRLAWLQRSAYAGTALVTVLLVAVWAFAYVQNKSYVRAVADESARVEQLLADVDARDTDPFAVLPVLDAARALPGGYADRLQGGSWFGGLGLSQSGKLGDRAVASYGRLLNELLLSRLMLRLENRLRAGGPTPDYTYEALKAYLMLDSEQHYDADVVRAFLGQDLSDTASRTAGAAQREALDAHLDALFEERPLPLPLALSDTVVAEARRDVRSIPLEERIYGRLKRSFAADIRGFNVRDAAGGPASELVFVRKSGRPLSEPLPALFTRSAYQQVFIDRSRALTSELASEAWILGEDETVDAAQQEQLLARVRELYLGEYADRYSETLLDVALAPFGTAEEAARIFNVLSRPEDSPLSLLLQEVARQTALDQVEQDAGVVARAEDRVAQLQQRLQRVLGSATQVPDDLTELLSRNVVEERFQPFNALVRQAEGQPRPVDHLLGLMQELYQYLSVVASEAAGGAIPPHIQQNGQAVLQRVRMEASAQPSLLVGELLQTAAARTNALTTGGLRAYLNELWQSGPLLVCRRAIAGRYPVESGSEQEIRLDDFGEFFGYGGLVDSFFGTHLRQYVDSTSSPWRARATGNVPIQLSAAALQAFENADVIKRTFFRPGSMQPSIAFDLRPLEMDTSLSRFLLDLEGEVIEYEFGPQTPTLMQWPGPNPGTEVRIELRDRDSGATAMERLQGPWAWFRLLDRSGLTPAGGPEQFEVTFSQGGRDVVYELTARSAFNPFALPQLQRFQCPGSL